MNFLLLLAGIIAVGHSGTAQAVVFHGVPLSDSELNPHCPVDLVI